MTYCELMKDCRFLHRRMSLESGFGAVYMRRYCRGDSMKCARYTVARILGQERVPSDLFPNMGSKARNILGKA